MTRWVTTGPAGSSCRLFEEGSQSYCDQPAVTTVATIGSAGREAEAAEVTKPAEGVTVRAP